MKLNRLIIYLCIPICIVSLILSAIFRYVIINDYLSNVLIGIFSSVTLVLITSLINYHIEKIKEIASYSNFTNCLPLKISPIYNLFKGADRNIELEQSLILDWKDYLMENIHMPVYDFDFIFPNSKLEKIIDETDEMMVEFYEKVVTVSQVIYEYKFGLVDIEKYDQSFQELLIYLRNYNEDLYINILSHKHDDIINLCKLKYKKASKIKLY